MASGTEMAAEYLAMKRAQSKPSSGVDMAKEYLAMKQGEPQAANRVSAGDPLTDIGMLRVNKQPRPVGPLAKTLFGRDPDAPTSFSEPVNNALLGDFANPEPSTNPTIPLPIPGGPTINVGPVGRNAIRSLAKLPVGATIGLADMISHPLETVKGIAHSLALVPTANDPTDPGYAAAREEINQDPLGPAMSALMVAGGVGAVAKPALAKASPVADAAVGSKIRVAPDAPEVTVVSHTDSHTIIRNPDGKFGAVPKATGPESARASTESTAPTPAEPPAPVVKQEAQPAAKQPWYRGQDSRNASGDKFYSASEDVAGDFGKVSPINPPDIPKNPLVVESKDVLAERIGYKGDPMAEPKDAPVRFDDLAKAYAIKNGHDGIIYENGTMDARELHTFTSPAPLQPQSQIDAAAVKGMINAGKAPINDFAPSQNDVASTARRLVADKGSQRVGQLDWTVDGNDVRVAHSVTGRDYGTIDLETGQITPTKTGDAANLKSVYEHIKSQAEESKANSALGNLMNYPLKNEAEINSILAKYPRLRSSYEKWLPPESPQAAPMRRAEMPVSMERQSAKPTSVNDIRQHFETSLDVPIRTGKYNTRTGGMKAGGIFKAKADVIRLRDYADVETLSHEVAHKMEAKYKLASLIDRFKSELGPLDYEAGKARPTEGFAEWMRHYLTGSGDAQALAPEFSKAFNDYLKTNPELARTITQGKSLFDSWRSQGAEARVKAAIVNDPPRNPVKQTLATAKNWFLREFDDAMTPIRHFTEAAERQLGRKLRGDENPFELATALKGTARSRAQTWIKDRTINFDGQDTGAGLEEIFKPVKGMEEKAIEYAYAKHGIERWKQGKNPGSDLADLEYFVDKNKSPEFDAFSKNISAYRDRLLQYVVDAGGLDPKTAQLFRDTYQSSIPLYREGFETGTGGIGGKSYGDLGKPLKRAHGSGREVINPIAGLLKETERLISFADRVRVGSSVANIAETVPGMGRWIEKVNLPAKAMKLNSDQVKAHFEQAGIDLGNLDPKQLDKMLTTFSQQVAGIPSENIITFYKDGKLSAYQLSPELYGGIKEVQPWAASGFIKLLTIPKKVVAAGATGLRPSFGLLTNMLRDPWTAMMQSRSGKTVTPFGSLAGTMRMAAQKMGIRSPELTMFQRLGGEQANFFNSELPKAMENAKRIVLDNNRSKAMNVVRHPFDLYREILNTPETGPRSVEFVRIYDKVLKETGNHRTAWIEALNASKNVTMNFGRAGRTAAIINQFIPFFNPALQEPGLVLRTFRRNPVGTLAKGVAGMTIPTILLWQMNKDQDWYKALPTWEKATFWHFRIGDTTWRLPKPFLWGGIFASSPEAMLDSWEKKNPQIVKDMLTQIGSNTIPSLTPPMVSVPASLLAGEAGYDYFRGRNIVPQSQVETLPPSERYGRYTSETAKKVGDVLNVSPSKVDFAISGFTGGLGTDVIQLGEKMFGLKASERGIENTPFVGRLVSRSPYLGKFYDEATQLKDQVKELKVKLPASWTPEDRKALAESKRYDAYSSQLSMLRKRITVISKSAMASDVKARQIERLQTQMEDLAHRALYGTQGR